MIQCKIVWFWMIMLKEMIIEFTFCCVSKDGAIDLLWNINFTEKGAVLLY